MEHCADSVATCLTKKCKTCSVEKALDDFGLQAKGRLGRTARCRKCLSAVNRHRWATNHSVRDGAKRRKANRSEVVREQQREWRGQNRGRIRAAYSAWAAENSGKVAGYLRTWRAKNPQQAAAYGARRRRPGWASWTDLKAVYEAARKLAEKTGVKHHVDHIYPLDPTHGVCGLHCPANLRPIEFEENLRKKNRLPGFLAAELWDPEGPGVYHQ